MQTRAHAHTHVTIQRSAKREKETIVSTSKEKTTTTEQTTLQRVKRRIEGLSLFILIGRSLASFEKEKKKFFLLFISHSCCFASRVRLMRLSR